MAEASREGTILRIGETIRIEPGPVLIMAEATETLLANDATADHYQAPRDATPEEIEQAGTLTEGDQRLFLDALGQPIRIGQEMAYLDWLGHSEGKVGATGFYVYALEPRTAEEREALGIAPDATDPDQTHIWRQIGCEPDESAALTVAFNHLQGA